LAPLGERRFYIERATSIDTCLYGIRRNLVRRAVVYHLIN
jgi:hypothetical protein